MPESGRRPTDRLKFKPTDTELKDIMLERALRAGTDGRHLLAAALFKALAELEFAEAYADVLLSAETAWNQRTTAVPLIRPVMRTERPRMAQRDMGQCTHGHNTYTDDGGRVHIPTGSRCSDPPEPRHWTGTPAHDTCLDVSAIEQGIGREYVCGPDCPPHNQHRSH